jgi:hypothetical protein
MNRKLSRFLFALGLSFSLTAVGAAPLVSASGGGGENSPKKSRRGAPEFKITAIPVGPSSQTIEAAKAQAARSVAVQSRLKGAKSRLLSLEYVENGTSLPPTRYRAFFYDYANDRVLVAEGSFADATAGRDTVAVVREENFQPTPSDEEFAEAVRIVQSDRRFAAAMRGNALRPFRPMPDVTVLSGTTERLVNVGLESFGEGARNEIVSVSINRGQVLRYPEGAPEQSKSAPESCGIPGANQGTTANGTAGQLQLNVDGPGGARLWEMLVVRPSASSGTRKSGIEVRDVKYKGKSVLKRGHVPVLNVQYDANFCGPYRDWQWQEGMFQTPETGNTDPPGAPGFRILAAGQVATTSIETGNDVGNFRGVAVYAQNDEIILVSELEASWYRYIMEWRFAADGTIRPRFGFGAVNNFCVCGKHNHHAYWRFDFDIVQPANQIFQVERGRKFLRPITNELKLLRSYQTNRSLLIQNAAGNEAYLMVPSLTDGNTDAYGRGDMWILRHKSAPGGTALQNEIDDGINCTSCPDTTIQIDSFLNDESVKGEDIVVWYGAHFAHTDGSSVANANRSDADAAAALSGKHVVGPDLRPVRW